MAFKSIDTNRIVYARTIISIKHIITTDPYIFKKERYFFALCAYASITDLRDANGSVYNIDRFFVHSGFEGRIVGSTNWHNDIAVLKVRNNYLYP
jgi:hypothetical protein